MYQPIEDFNTQTTDTNQDGIINAALGEYDNVMQYSADLAPTVFGSVGEFAMDAVHNPHGFVDAAIVNAVVDIVNIPSNVFGFDPLKEEDYMFSAGKEFYAQHEIGVEAASLLVGGAGVISGGTKALVNGVKFSRAYLSGATNLLNGVAAVEKGKEAVKVLKTAGMFSEAYSSTVKGVWANAVIGGAIEGVAQEALIATLFQNNALMEDYDAVDFGVGAIIGGGLSAVFRGVPKQLELKKAVAEKSSPLRKELKDLSPTYLVNGVAGNDLVLATQSVNKLAGLETAAIEQGLKGVATDVKAYSLDLEAGMVDKLNDLLHPSLRTSKSGEAELGNAYDMPKLRSIIVDDMASAAPERIVGVRNLKPFKVSDHFVEFKTGEVGIPKYAAELPNDPKAIQLYHTLLAAEETTDNMHLLKQADDLAVGLDKGTLKKVMIASKRDANTSLLSTNTRDFLSVRDAYKYAHGVDIGVKKPVIAKAEELNTPQLQFNLAAKAKTMSKPSEKLVKVNLDAPIDYQDVFELGFGLYKAVQRGGELPANLTKLVLRDGKSVTPDELLTFVHETTRTEVVKLLKHGYDYNEVSLRTGLDTANIVKLATNSSSEATQLVYKGMTKEGLDKEFKRTLLTVEGTPHDSIPVASKLDTKFVEAANKAAIDNALLGSNSKTVGKLIMQFSPYERTSVASHIKAQVGALAPELYSPTARKLNSADFAFRHQAISDAVTKFGDDIRVAGEALAEVRGKKVVSVLNAIAADRIERITMNQHINWLHSQRLTRGQYIDLIDGKLSVVENLGGKAKVVATAEVPVSKLQTKFFKEYREIYKDKLAAMNFSAEVTHSTPVADLGIKLPSKQLHTKHVAYVINPEGNTEVLYASTSEGLEALVTEARNAEALKPKHLQATVAYRDNKFNRIHARADLEQMNVADIQRAKTSAQYKTPAEGDAQIKELMDGIILGAHSDVKRIARKLNEPTFDYLERMHRTANAAEINQGVKSSAKVKRTVYSDIAATMMNSKLDTEGEYLTMAYEGLEGVLRVGLDTVGSVFNALKRPVSEENYKVVFDDLAKEFTKEGLELPFDNYRDLIASNLAHELPKDKARELTSALATLTTNGALRFLEVAHGLVNAVSTPIMLIPELQEALRLGGNGNHSVMKLMTEGIRTGFGHSAEAVDFQKRMINQGVIAPHVSEHADALAELMINPSKFDKVMSSGLVKKASYISDKSEILVRQAAAGMGYHAAKTVLGKGASLADVDAYAAAFVKRTMGNYNANQRPLAFQGVVGSSIGLFQTYVLTMGQRVFKSIETRDYKGLASMAAAQASIFGLTSLPAYDLINDTAAMHYLNAEHKNLDTEVYQQFAGSALGENTAEFILYGLPSSLLDMSLSSRATIDVRAPISYSEGEFKFTPAMMSPITAGAQVVNTVYEQYAAGNSLTTGLRLAMQQQSLSRPIARMTELLSGTGDSVDRAGRVIDSKTGFQLNLNTLARIASTRPIQETSVRRLKWQSTYYNSLSSSAKKSAISAIRAAASANKLDDSAVAQVQRRYLAAGGSETQWTKIKNEAILAAEVGTDMQKLFGKDTVQSKIASMLIGEGD